MPKNMLKLWPKLTHEERQVIRHAYKHEAYKEIKNVEQIMFFDATEVLYWVEEYHKDMPTKAEYKIIWLIKDYLRRGQWIET